MVKMETETSVEKLDEIEKDTNEAWKERQNETNERSMKQILKPVLLGLALAGCYNFTSTEMSKKSENKSSLKIVTSVIYRVIFLAITLLYLCKTIAACFYIPQEHFILNLQMIFWLVFCLCTYLIYIKSTSKKYGHHQQAFDFWTEKIMPDFKELQIMYPTIRMERWALAALIISIITVFFNVAASGIQIYLSKENILLYPFEIKPITLAIFFVLQTATLFIWVTPFVTVVVLSNFLKEAFNAVNQYWKSTCRRKGSETAIDFDKFRRLHLNLSKLVGDLDKDIGWYFAASFVFNVASSASLLYQMVQISMDTYLLVMFSFWLSGTISMATLTAIYAACLHEAAHAPLDTIYYINVQDITIEKLAQLNLFLSKLTGTQVGFSTCGLLIITKEFILTIAGVFLTYFAVLYTL